MADTEYRLQTAERNIEKVSDDTFLNTQQIAKIQQDLAVALNDFQNHTKGCSDSNERVEEKLNENSTDIKSLRRYAFAGLATLVVSMASILATILLSYTGVI